MGKKMKISGDMMGLFTPYLVMYGPDEAKTGIKGIRSDAPKEAIDAYLLWYRDKHRYKSGRIMNSTDKRLLELIIDVTNDNQENTDEGKEEPSSILCCKCLGTA